MEFASLDTHISAVLLAVHFVSKATCSYGRCFRGFVNKISYVYKNVFQFVIV